MCNPYPPPDLLHDRFTLRRLLDALWMSAKRNSDIITLSVADGRTLLTSLVTGNGQTKEEGASKAEVVDLGMPLPRGETDLALGGIKKPVRPVVGGASGPFARAARHSGESSASGSSNSSGGEGGSGQLGRGKSSTDRKRWVGLGFGWFGLS